MREESVLFKHLLNSGFLCVFEEEYKTEFLEEVKKREKNLKETLSEEQFKAVRNYLSEFSCHMFQIRDEECFKMLYLGIKLGMEVSDFCHKNAEEEVLEN